MVTKNTKIKRVSKKYKPNFNVLNAGFMVSVKERWRKPRGTANKKRRKYAFAGAHPRIGYKNTEAVRGFHVNGKKEVFVRGMPDMEKVKALTTIERTLVSLRFAAALSKRTRAVMAKMAKELGVTMLNYRENGAAKFGAGALSAKTEKKN